MKFKPTFFYSVVLFSISLFSIAQENTYYVSRDSLILYQTDSYLNTIAEVDKTSFKKEYEQSHNILTAINALGINEEDKKNIQYNVQAFITRFPHDSISWQDLTAYQKSNQAPKISDAVMEKVGADIPTEEELKQKKRQQAEEQEAIEEKKEGRFWRNLIIGFIALCLAAYLVFYFFSKRKP